MDGRFFSFLGFFEGSRETLSNVLVLKGTCLIEIPPFFLVSPSIFPSKVGFRAGVPSPFSEKNYISESLVVVFPILRRRKRELSPLGPSDGAESPYADVTFPQRGPLSGLPR